MATRRQLYDHEKKYVRAKAYPRKNRWSRYKDASWCSFFQFDSARDVGLGKWVDRFKNVGYCPTVMEDAKRLGCFHKKPKRGDFVLFDWDKNGVPNHIGFLVKKVKTGKHRGLYKTVEGNTSNENPSDGNHVSIKYRSPYYVIGFVRPPYDAPKKSKKKPKKYPTLKKGSSGKYVKALQKRLGIRADGVFGKKTEKAVKRFQKKKGLQVDGVVGAKTWKSLLKK